MRTAALTPAAVSFAHGAGYGGARFGYVAANAPVVVGYATGHGNDIDYYVSRSYCFFVATSIANR